VQFFNLKTRSHVEIPDENVEKTRMVRKTKSGDDQTRYALTALLDGSRLYKFVNEATFTASASKEVEIKK